MKKMSRMTAMLLALVLMVGLVACQGGSTRDGGTPATAADGDAAPAADGGETPAAPAGDGGSLQFWYWDKSMEEQYDLIIADFAEKTGVQVTQSITPWADYWTKLQTALPTGAGPDVFWLNHPNAVSYMPSGELLDISAYVEDGTLDMSVFEENLYTPFMLDGAYYGVPIFVDTIAMTYNKRMFDDAGVAYPEDGWTWDDMLEKAKALTITDDNGNTTQYGILMSHDVQAFTGPMLLQNGGKYYSDDRMECIIDNETNRETIQWMLDAAHVHGVSPTNQEILELTVQTMIINEMVAMCPDGLWNVAPVYEVLGDNMGIAPLPQQKQRGNIFHNLGYVGSDKTSNPEGVVAFLEYTTTKEHGDYVAKVFLPARIDTRQGWFDAYPDLDLEVYSDAIPYSTPLPIVARNAGPAYTIFNDEMEKIFTGTEVGDGLAVMQEVMNAEINR